MDKFINLMQGQDMDPITGTFPDNCSGYLADLRKSPTFAMSLGAKELFHTNFLAYLLENQSEDKKLQCIQSKLKNLLFGHDGIGRVITWREKYSLDLVIMPAPVIILLLIFIKPILWIGKWLILFILILMAAKIYYASNIDVKPLQPAFLQVVENS